MVSSNKTLFVPCRSEFDAQLPVSLQVSWHEIKNDDRELYNFLERHVKQFGENARYVIQSHYNESLFQRKFALGISIF